MKYLLAAVAVVAVAACSEPPRETATVAAEPPVAVPAAGSPATATALARATFASGCFWCTESDFDKVPGVVATLSGYTGGRIVNPTYEQVSSGGTGHVESVEVTFDPSVVSYDTLLDAYWRNVDPFNGQGQFCDFGEQYRPVIWVRDDAQRTAAEASRARIERQLGKSVVVAIEPAETFYPAETYHQDYYKKNPVRYNYYRWGCGRDARLTQIWGSGD